MQSAAFSLPHRFRDAAKHSKSKLSDRQGPVGSIVALHPDTPLPSSRIDHCAGEGHMAAETTTRNRGISRTEVERRIGTALSKALPQYVAPAKLVAVDIGVSPRTVENLRANIPEAMITMGMIGCVRPEFALQMADMWGLDIDTSRGYAEYLAFQRRLIERLK